MFDLEFSTPAAEGFDPTAFAAAVAELDANPLGVRTFLMMRHGRIIVERYYRNLDPADLHRVASVTKSVLSTLVGIAIEQGILAGLDQTVGELIPPQIGRLQRAKAHITLRHLLSHTDGLTLPPEQRERCDSHADHAIASLLLTDCGEPGTKFEYSNRNYAILSRLLTFRTGMNAAVFAQRHLFEPLGIASFLWPVDAPIDTAWGWSGLRMTARDMAKIGWLWLQNGRWHGRAIVSGRYVAEALRQHSAGGPPSGDPYGLGWWLGGLGGYRMPAAMGEGGQLIALFPELDAVVVCAADGPSDMGKFLARRILPTVTARP